MPRGVLSPQLASFTSECHIQAKLSYTISCKFLTSNYICQRFGDFDHDCVKNGGRAQFAAKSGGDPDSKVIDRMGVIPVMFPSPPLNQQPSRLGGKHKKTVVAGIIKPSPFDVGVNVRFHSKREHDVSKPIRHLTYIYSTCRYITVGNINYPSRRSSTSRFQGLE